jgi:rubrerythrin
MSRALRPATLQTGLHVENLLLCLQAARQHARLAGCPATLRKVKSALKSAEGVRRHLARRLAAATGTPDLSEVRRFRNFYRCDRCGHEWEDVWSAACDDDCPACGARHMSPYESQDFGGAP